MSAGRICIRNVDIATIDESAQTAARRMKDRKVGTLVVLSSDSKPVGIVTDRDLALRVLAEGRDGTQTKVVEVMTPAPNTVRESTPIEDALRIMRAGAFRRVPVVNAEDHLVGLLALDDILELLAEELTDIGRLMHAEEPASLGRE